MKYSDDLNHHLDKWTVIKGDFGGWHGAIYHNHDPAGVFVYSYISLEAAKSFSTYYPAGEMALVVKPLRYFGKNKLPSNHSTILGDALYEVIKSLFDESD